MTFSDFLNGLRALQAIELAELRAAGVDFSPAAWQHFRSNPAKFLAEAEDIVAIGVFAVVQARGAHVPQSALRASDCHRLADAFRSLAGYAEGTERAEAGRLGLSTGRSYACLADAAAELLG